MENSIDLLCHPDGLKSCASCCGLYNRKEISRDGLTDRLSKRRKQWLQSNKNPQEYLDTNPVSLGALKLDFIHNCSFISFVDEANKRVGCLLHDSLGAEGQRAHCPFGKCVSDEYVCSTHKILSQREKEILITCIDDWYLYGLLISDPFFIRTVIIQAEDQLGYKVTKESLKNPACFEVLRTGFSEKLAG